MEHARKKQPKPDELPSPGSDSTQVGPFAARLPTERRHASLIVVQGAEIGREYRLRRIDSVLGRDDGAGLRISDDRVSRNHARIVVRKRPGAKSEMAIQDLGSRNGTWVNGRKIKGMTTLADGDKVQLGNTILKFILQDDLDAQFHEEVRYRLAYDQLTGLLTRESLHEALDSELKRCAPHDLPLTILAMDLDAFRKVNESHGHLTGSFVIREVGRLLKESFRTTDVAARYGGEEFVAYLTEIPASEGMDVAERMRRAVEQHRFTRTLENGTPLTITLTISIGVAEFPTHGVTREELIAAADQALARAKSEGRNRVCLSGGPPKP